MRPCPTTPGRPVLTRKNPPRLCALGLCERGLTQLPPSCPAQPGWDPAERGPVCPAALAWGPGIPVLGPPFPQPHNDSVRFNGGKYSGETL